MGIQAAAGGPLNKYNHLYATLANFWKRTLASPPTGGLNEHRNSMPHWHLRTWLGEFLHRQQQSEFQSMVESKAEACRRVVQDARMRLHLPLHIQELSCYFFGS